MVAKARLKHIAQAVKSTREAHKAVRFESRTSKNDAGCRSLCKQTKQKKERGTQLHFSRNVLFKVVKWEQPKGPLCLRHDRDPLCHNLTQTYIKLRLRR